MMNITSRFHRSQWFRNGVISFTGIWMLAVCTVGMTLFYPENGRCSDLQTALLGEWYETGGGEVINVLGEGKVILNFSGFLVKGQYEFIEYDRIRFESLFGSMVYSVKLADATLRLIDDENNARIYVKRITDSATAACPPQASQIH